MHKNQPLYEQDWIYWQSEPRTDHFTQSLTFCVTADNGVCIDFNQYKLLHYNVFPSNNATSCSPYHADYVCAALRIVLDVVVRWLLNFERSYLQKRFWPFDLTQFNSVGPWIVSNHSMKFRKDLIRSFWVIMLTDSQTDRQTNRRTGRHTDRQTDTSENITSSAEVTTKNKSAEIC